MNSWECNVCGYIYDPDIGDDEYNFDSGIIFNELPDEWECPVCGAGKTDFKEIK